MPAALANTSPVIVSHIVDMYQVDGQSARSIARIIGSDHTTISRILKGQGICLDRSRRTKMPSVPQCSRCSIRLDEVRWHKNGMCCICYAIKARVVLGTWVWRGSDDPVLLSKPQV